MAAGLQIDPLSGSIITDGDAAELRGRESARVFTTYVADLNARNVDKLDSRCPRLAAFAQAVATSAKVTSAGALRRATDRIAQVRATAAADRAEQEAARAETARREMARLDAARREAALRAPASASADDSDFVQETQRAPSAAASFFDDEESAFESFIAPNEPPIWDADADIEADHARRRVEQQPSQTIAGLSVGPIALERVAFDATHQSADARLTDETLVAGAREARGLFSIPPHRVAPVRELSEAESRTVEDDAEELAVLRDRLARQKPKDEMEHEDAAPAGGVTRTAAIWAVATVSALSATALVIVHAPDSSLTGQSGLIPPALPTLAPIERPETVADAPRDFGFEAAGALRIAALMDNVPGVVRALDIDPEVGLSAPGASFAGTAVFQTPWGECARYGVDFFAAPVDQAGPRLTALIGPGAPVPCGGDASSASGLDAATGGYLSDADLRAVLAETPVQCVTSGVADGPCLETIVYEPDAFLFTSMSPISGGARLEIEGAYAIRGGALCHQTVGVLALVTGGDMSAAEAFAHERLAEADYAAVPGGEICYRLTPAPSLGGGVEGLYTAHAFVSGRRAHERTDPRPFEMRAAPSASTIAQADEF